MKKIPLTRDFFAVVDDEDFEELSKFKWTAHVSGRRVYAVRRKISKTDVGTHVKMHRVILGIKDSKIHVDHRDGDGLNNQKNNLRKCTNDENLRNRRANINNTSGFKGVSWEKHCSKWRVRIRFNGKLQNVGLFSDIKDAAKAYNYAAVKHYGEFARLNKVD